MNSDPPAPPPGQDQGGWNQPPQQYGQYQQDPQPYQQPPGPQGSRTPGVAVAALVCGILALLLSWVPIIGLVAFPLGIAAVVTGVIGLRKSKEPGYGGRGLAIGGLVTGVLGLVVALLIAAVFVNVLNDPDTQDLIEDVLESATISPS